MAEHPVALYFPSSEALWQGTTSLPKQLGRSADFGEGTIVFKAVGETPPILPGLRAEYYYNRRSGQFLAEDSNLKRDHQLDLDLIGQERLQLSHALLLGGRVAEVEVTVGEDILTKKGGKRSLGHFVEGFLAELTDRGYIPTEARFIYLQGSGWNIDNVDLFLGIEPEKKSRFYTPVFSMEVTKEGSDRWLKRLFEETKDRPFYDHEYQRAVMACAD